MDTFTIVTGIAGLVGALSWIPILIDKCKKREVRSTLIHCRFFNGFSIPILPPDYTGRLSKQPEVKFDKYEGALIVLGINICSINKDFVVDKVSATLILDKSEHQAILISPDVIVPNVSTQDDAPEARLSIPPHMDLTKMKNIQANINTRVYMAFVCKDLYSLDYDHFSILRLLFEDIKGKTYQMEITKEMIETASLIRERDIYDVEYKARIGNRKIYETAVDTAGARKILEEALSGVQNGGDRP